MARDADEDRYTSTGGAVACAVSDESPLLSIDSTVFFR
jgi:hypothetical protein